MALSRAHQRAHQPPNDDRRTSRDVNLTWSPSRNIAVTYFYLSILISLTPSRASCTLVVANVSAPYNRAGLTTVLVNISLQFHWHPPVAQHSTGLTICVIDVAMLPVSSALEPRYLQRCTLCSSSPMGA